MKKILELLEQKVQWIVLGIAVLYAGFASLLHRPVEHRRIVVEVVSWYWHFMGVLWLYVFALLEFAM